MRKIALILIGFYQKMRGARSRSCVFEPTCSEYTRQAIEKYGFLKGFGMGLGRILRCHPWQKNHYDPVK